MHELSIAMSLIEMAVDALEDTVEADGADHPRVTAVYVRVGVLAGVVEDALRFSFDVAAGGTSLEGARLVVEQVPVAVRCRACGVERVLADPFPFRCPLCGSAAELVRGRDIELTALEVEDRSGEPTAPAGARSRT